MAHGYFSALPLDEKRKQENRASLRWCETYKQHSLKLLFIWPPILFLNQTVLKFINLLSISKTGRWFGCAHLKCLYSRSTFEHTTFFFIVIEGFLWLETLVVKSSCSDAPWLTYSWERQHMFPNDTAGDLLCSCKEAGFLWCVTLQSLPPKTVMQSVFFSFSCLHP